MKAESTIIAAVSDDFVIGKDLIIPWYIPEDLKNFRRITTGSPVVMGKLTFLSIIKAIGKPLPGRTNYVISSTLEYQHESVKIVIDIPKALELCEQAGSQKIFFIGGQRIYEEAIVFVHKMLLTHVQTEIEDGDTFFPLFNEVDWEVFHGEEMADKTSGLRFNFSTYTRKLMQTNKE